MRSRLAKIFTGTHLDYGINDGHVTSKLFGKKPLGQLYVADIENKLAAENELLSDNFLETDPATCRVDVEDSRFDSISCMHVIEHVPNSSLLLKEFNRILKRGGLLYLEAPNRRSLYIPSISKGRTWNFHDDPTHVRPYSTKDLRSVCEAHGLRVLKSGIYRNRKYALAFPVSPFVSLLLRDWRPLHYSTIHLAGWSSYVLCQS